MILFFHGTSIIHDFLFFLDVAVTLNYWVTVATSTSTLSDTIAIGVRVMSIPRRVIFIGWEWLSHDQDCLRYGCHVLKCCVYLIRMNLEVNYIDDILNSLKLLLF